MGKRRSRSRQLVKQKAASLLSAVDSERGWATVWDVPSGAFQQDHHSHNPYRIQRNWTVFSCQTLIAGDMGKMRVELREWNAATEIYEEVESPAFSPFLRKPNPFQTWQKFIESWMFSKLSNGNAYILKERDNRGVVIAGYVLDPHRVTPLVAPNGSVYYQLNQDDLAQVPENAPVAPASEIMHDRMWCLFHPLVGLSPIFACGLSAIQGLEIQGNSAKFFANMSRPSGILVAPGPIPDEMALAYKKRWEENYTGTHGIGRVAVLGNGLKYEAMTQNAVDSELIKQLMLTAEMICSAYHVPGYKIGVGVMPTYQNAEVLNQIYYDDCLQTLIRGVQTQLNEGLGLVDVPGRTLRARFNLEDLLMMDSATQIDGLNKAVAGGWMAPNEARQKRNMKPVEGGDSPMMQQQQFALGALRERDSNKPFAKPTAPPAATPALPDPATGKSNVYAMIARARKGLKNAA